MYNLPCWRFKGLLVVRCPDRRPEEQKTAPCLGFSSMFLVSSLVFPLCVCFSSVVCRFVPLFVAFFSCSLLHCLRFFSSCFLLHCFFLTFLFWLIFPFPSVCVCCLLFVVCFDNPPFPSILLLFFPVVVLFCCPIKTGRNGPIKNPDNGRKSVNKREVEGANQRAVLCTN